MATSTMCPFPYKNNGQPHCNVVLRCCDKFPNICIPSQVAKKDRTKKLSTIRFHVFRKISRCTLHVRRLYKERTESSMCSTVPITAITAKYTHGSS